MFLIVSHCLVYWVEEDSIAVVKRQQVMGDGEIGEVQNVKWGKKCYRVKVAAVGKHLCTCLSLNNPK